MTDSMFNAYNPYLNGIDGTALIFAARTLFEVREALEHGIQFRTELARRNLEYALREAEAIRDLLEQRKAA